MKKEGLFPSVQLESFRFSTDTKETAIVLNEKPNVAVKRDLISRVPMCQKVRLMWWQPLSFRFVQAWNKIDIYPNLRKLIPFVPGSSRDIKIYPQSSLTDVVSGNISSSDSTRLCDMAGVIGITAPEGKAIYACKKPVRENAKSSDSEPLQPDPSQSTNTLLDSANNF